MTFFFIATHYLQMSLTLMIYLLFYPLNQVGLLVLLAAVVGGVVYMKQNAPEKKLKAKRTPMKKSPYDTVSSPTVTRKAAKGTGSVKTPSGRRSARIARKSLED